MMLSKGSYWLYPADSFMFRVYKSKARTNILAPRAFACVVLGCLISQVIMFGSDERVSGGSFCCSSKFYKIIQKTVAMEYFISKFEDLKTASFKIKKNSFLNGVTVEYSGVVGSVVYWLCVV